MIVKADVDMRKIFRDRERMVFLRMMQGKTLKEIAEEFNVTEDRISDIQNRIYYKMNDGEVE